MPRLLFLCHSLPHEDFAFRLREELAPQTLLVVRLEEGLGGVWSEFSDGQEVIRLGYPAASPHAFFQPLRPRRGQQTCASVALGRMVFGRRIQDVVTLEPALAPVLGHALAGHHVRCWIGRRPLPPEALGRPGRSSSFVAPEELLEGLADWKRRAQSAALANAS